MRSLIQAGVSRVVLGMRHPLRHQRGAGVTALRSAGIEVEVLGESESRASDESQAAALSACLSVNEVRQGAGQMRGACLRARVVWAGWRWAGVGLSVCLHAGICMQQWMYAQV